MTIRKFFKARVKYYHIIFPDATHEQLTDAAFYSIVLDAIQYGKEDELRAVMDNPKAELPWNPIEDPPWGGTCWEAPPN